MQAAHSPATPDLRPGQRIAVVGTGIAGLTAAWLLKDRHDVHLFEAGSYAGGHTNTEHIPLGGTVWPVNTGFIVYNDWTYPNFIRLMQQLGVASEASSMSFSVQCARSGLEYNGTSFDTLFAQRRNLMNPRFLRMIAEIIRFNRVTRADLQAQRIPPEETLAEYLVRYGFSRYFRDNYIVPMGSAIWSAPEATMDAFPVAFFLRFFNNHGMLSVDDRPTWRVLKGGSASYVLRMLPAFGDRLHLNTPVTRVERHTAGVTLCTHSGRHDFDQVILACHSPEALKILAQPSAEEQAILGALPYQNNDVVLHTDHRMLPTNPRAWAAWNYHLPDRPEAPVSVTYNMNILQNLKAPETFCVTLNRNDQIDPRKILKRYQYEHPVFTVEGLAAQARHGEISGHRRTHYCGAYWFNGFHEDGVRSGVRVAQALGAVW